MRYGAMHYKKRSDTKIITPRYEIDYRIMDLLDLTNRKKGLSKNKIFEMAVVELCRSPSLKFYFKTRRRKRFMAKREILALIESTSLALRIPKNEIVNKSLKNFLGKNFE